MKMLFELHESPDEIVRNPRVIEADLGTAQVDL
jgi:hypothetical protein